MEHDSDSRLSIPSLAARYAKSLLVIFAVWAGLRAIFFQGLEGYDDISYVRFAADPGMPVDVFEVRFLFNSLLAASIRLLGFNEFAYAGPALLGSAVIVFCSWLTAMRLAGPRAALGAGFAAALIGLDVNNSTVPMVNTVAAAFAAAGVAVAVRERTVMKGILTGALMGLAINTHMATAFFFLPFLICWFLFAERGTRFRQTAVMLGSVLLTFAVTEAALGTTYTGNPMIRFELIQSTHLAVQHYEVPPTLDDGTWNPDWFTWPLKSLLVSKEFGVLLSVMLLGLLCLNKRLTKTDWFLAGITITGWLYICFGSQIPHRYQPLDHQTRYWYPLVMPLAALFGITMSRINRTGLRSAYIGLCLLPLPLLMTASGSWGQNVEISRELLAHAAAHSDTHFITDQYTWEEIETLSDFDPPTNICVIAQPDNPADYPGPDCGDDVVHSPNVEALINIMHLDRPRSHAFRAVLEALPSRTAVSEPAPRTIARFLPASMRKSDSWIRKPAAWVGRRSDIPDRTIDSTSDNSTQEVAQQ